MIEVVILSGADADLDDIYSFLGERGGERFLLALDRKLELLRTFPRMAPRALAARVRQNECARHK